MKPFGHVACGLAMLVVLGAAATTAASKVENNAWKIGEILQYDLSYGLLKAGTATYSIESGPAVAGRETVKFVSKLKSGKMFFYKIDDVMTSTSDASSLSTFKYEKRQREGDYANDEFTTFNHKTATAQRNDDGNQHEPMAFTQYAKDVLGAIYYVRTQSLDGKTPLKFAVHDGRRDYTMEVKIIKREKIKVGAGEFDCIVIEPKMYNAQGPLKKGQMTLWLTDDARRIPVRIKMGIAVGSVTGNLKSMSGVL